MSANSPVDTLSARLASAACLTHDADDDNGVMDEGLTCRATQWDKIAWKKEQRLDEDVHFPSDCGVAAAVCLKCISANSCAIRRRERGTAMMGCHDETKESGWQRGEEGEREEASECGEKGKSDGGKGETEMELSSRPFTAIISL